MEFFANVWILRICFFFRRINKMFSKKIEYLFLRDNSATNDTQNDSFYG